MIFDFPELGARSPFNAIVLQQGVDADLLQELSEVPSLFGDAVDDRIDQRLSNSEVAIESDELRTTLSYDGVLFSEIIFKKK